MTERIIQLALWWRHSGCRIVLPNYTPHGWHECDVFVVTQAGFTIEYEIKISRADFVRDLKKTAKHQRLKGLCAWEAGRPNRFFFAVPEGMIQASEIPDYAGLVYLRRHVNGLIPLVRVVRPAPRLKSEHVASSVVEHMNNIVIRRLWHERWDREEFRRNLLDKQAAAV